MNGAELLVKTANSFGVEVCFANPGTTEMPVVVAFDSVPGVRSVLGLFEGVCTGAADGYGRMLDKAAMTLLHLGPGFANGVANLHDARRAQSPVLNVVGEHATWHRDVDPPLAMDIEGLAKTVSGWWRTNKTAQVIGVDVADAIIASRLGQVATLMFPHDHQLTECEDHRLNDVGIPYDPIDDCSIEGVRARLHKFQKVALLLGGRALRRPGLEAAGRIRKAIRCDLYSPTLPGYVEQGLGLPVVERVPYLPERALAAFSGYEAVLLAGAHEPVTFFGYTGMRSRVLSDEQEKITLCTDRQDVVKALDALAYLLGAENDHASDEDLFARPNRPELPHGELTAEKACLTVAGLQPEGAIIIDEAVTTRHSYLAYSAGLPPHSILTVAGGSIGFGIPCAIGAAIACPERPVIDLQADGSALYTVQGLWTQAREGLNITTLLCSNRSYRILQLELKRAGLTSCGPNASGLTELKSPLIDWPKVARGFGIPGVKVDKVERLALELRKALSEPGPHLIEMLLP